MIFFDGTYRLRHPGRRSDLSDTGTALAWRVRIINLSISHPEVAHLRPFIVFTAPTGDGIFKASCAESLGKSICRDFELNLRKTLWVECLPDAAGRLKVARFIPRAVGPETSYWITWRPIRSNERETLLAFLPQNECYGIK